MPSSAPPERAAATAALRGSGAAPPTSSSSLHPRSGHSRHATSAHASSPPLREGCAPPSTTPSPAPVAAAHAPARAVGPTPPPPPVTSRHVYVSRLSANASEQNEPNLSAPSATSISLPATNATWSPRADGAVPRVGCSWNEPVSASKTRTEAEQRWLWRRTRPSPVAHATWREVGPPGTRAGSSRHSRPLKTHTSSRISPPVPSSPLSQPPNIKTSDPTVAAAEHRRARGVGPSHSTRAQSSAAISHVSATQLRSPASASAYPPNINIDADPVPSGAAHAPERGGGAR
mmetsp:Transcript_12650/g.41702  ORF Transcript_12650/g.41702 Transcript_12650/m.41702 type:complete len:289 (-) Transcript_12650:106-972(-)